VEHERSPTSGDDAAGAGAGNADGGVHATGPVHAREPLIMAIFMLENVL